MRLKREHQPRVIWLFALLVCAFGCRTIADRETAIGDAVSAGEQLTRRIEASERDIADAAALRRGEQMARLDLRRVSGEQRAVMSVAGFLQHLERSTARFGLIALSVTPSVAPPVRQPSRTALVPLPVTVLVRGNFRSIVGFLQEITRQKSLTGIEDAQIVVSPSPATRLTPLDATIHLTLYRLDLNIADAAAH